MKGPFAPEAARLCGIACRQSGWSMADFWAATPAEIMLLLTPAAPGGADSISRTDLNRLMEREGNG